MATPIPENRASLTVGDVVSRTRGGVLRGDPSATATGIVSDSRAVRPGSVFVALRGDSHDGHAFVARAVEAGAALVVVERGRVAPNEVPGDAAVVAVDDTLVAWGDLARGHLERWRALGGRRVVGITGSAGKTTTKELTAALLGAVAPCHFPAGNLNNRIGVPATIFALQDDHRFCVLEMGMSLPGEIAAVASIGRPDVGVVTNIGVAHAEGVGGQHGVFREKRAMYEALAEDGVAIVNADDALVRKAAAATRARRLETFGRDATSTYRLVSRTPRDGGGSELAIACASGAAPAHRRAFTVFLPLPGEVAAVDLLAALAAQEAASGVELAPEQIERALAGVRLAGRAHVRTLEDGTIVVDDTYNANPASVRAALATLGEIGPGRRRVAILGEMKELGALADAEHDALGDVLVQAGVALAIGCGGLVGRALERARTVAGDAIEIVPAATTRAAADEAVRRVLPGDVVLVKGSRSVGAEQVVAALAASRSLKSPESLPSSGKSASSGAE